MKRSLVNLVLRSSSILLVALCGCANDSEATPEIVDAERSRGTELTFRIARRALRADGSQTFAAVASLQGRSLGFDLELGPWCENPPGYVDMPTWDCKARLV